MPMNPQYERALNLRANSLQKEQFVNCLQRLEECCDEACRYKSLTEFACAVKSFEIISQREAPRSNKG